jgi:hypothetical protein
MHPRTLAASRCSPIFAATGAPSAAGAVPPGRPRGPPATRGVVLCSSAGAAGAARAADQRRDRAQQVLEAGVRNLRRTAQVGERGSHHSDDAQQVHGDHVLPVVGGHGFVWSGHVDAGRGHHRPDACCDPAARRTATSAALVDGTPTKLRVRVGAAGRDTLLTSLPEGCAHQQVAPDGSCRGTMSGLEARGYAGGREARRRRRDHGSSSGGAKRLR